jgi:gamma-polyglutamate biosynthesis protein CapA
MKRLMLVLVVAGGLILLLNYSRPLVVSKDNGATVIVGEKTKGEAKILFVGDIFLDRYIRQIMERHGGDYVFECTENLLQSADVVVGNLEGPITDFDSKSVGTIPGSPENYVFTFPTFSAELLYRHNIKIVSLGNNHIGNFGAEGIEQTKKYLSRAGVNYFGGLAGDEPIYRTKIRGHNISFIAYNEFGGDSAELVTEKIRQENMQYPENKIIVFAHWGDEYVEPTEKMRLQAKAFSRAGTNFFIGSHPHVVQASENIGETTVFYSLGNFIFDQYWDEEVSTGLAVQVNLSSSEITFQKYPLTILRSGQTCLK